MYSFGIKKQPKRTTAIILTMIMVLSIFFSNTIGIIKPKTAKAATTVQNIRGTATVVSYVYHEGAASPIEQYTGQSRPFCGARITFDSGCDLATKTGGAASIHGISCTYNANTRTFNYTGSWGNKQTVWTIADKGLTITCNDPGLAPPKDGCNYAGTKTTTTSTREENGYLITTTTVTYDVWVSKSSTPSVSNGSTQRLKLAWTDSQESKRPITAELGLKKSFSDNSYYTNVVIDSNYSRSGNTYNLYKTAAQAAAGGGYTVAQWKTDVYGQTYLSGWAGGYSPKGYYYNPSTGKYCCGTSSSTSPLPPQVLQMSSDSDPYVTGLEPGTYYLKEVEHSLGTTQWNKTASGWAGYTPITVTKGQKILYHGANDGVTGGGTTVLTNYPINLNFSFEKLDNTTGDINPDLEGTVIEVFYRKNGGPLATCYKDDNNKTSSYTLNANTIRVCGLVVGADGKLYQDGAMTTKLQDISWDSNRQLFLKAPIGVYGFIEVKTANGYFLGNDYYKILDFRNTEKSIDQNGSDKSGNLTVAGTYIENDYGHELKAKKVYDQINSTKYPGHGSNSVSLENVFSGVYKKDGAVYALKYGTSVSNSTVIAQFTTDADGNGIFTPNTSDSYGATLSTKDDGKTLIGLKASDSTHKYYLTETTAPSGFRRISNTLEIPVPAVNDTISFGTGSYTSTSNMYDNYLLGSLSLNKTIVGTSDFSGMTADQLLQTGILDGAEFKVFYIPAPSSTSTLKNAFNNGITITNTNATTRTATIASGNFSHDGVSTPYSTLIKEIGSFRIANIGGVHKIQAGYFNGSSFNASSGNTISGYNPNTNTASGSYKITVDNSGNIGKFTDLPAGIYCIVETKAPGTKTYNNHTYNIGFTGTDKIQVSKYPANDTANFELIADAAEVTGQTPDVVKLNLYKFNEKGNFLTGATYYVLYNPTKEPDVTISYANGSRVITVNDKASAPANGNYVAGKTYYAGRFDYFSTASGYGVKVANNCINPTYAGGHYSTWQGVPSAYDPALAADLDSVYGTNFANAQSVVSSSNMNDVYRFLGGRPGYYTLVEGSAPWRYMLNDTPLTQYIAASGEYMFEDTDYKLKDPLAITVNKVDSVSGEIYKDKLDGTKFVLNFYEGQTTYTSVKNNSLTPSISLEYEVKNGKVNFSDTSYLTTRPADINDYITVAGSKELINFPIGLVTVTETEAANGYNIGDLQWNVGGQSLMSYSTDADYPASMVVRLSSFTNQDGQRIGKEYLLADGTWSAKTAAMAEATVTAPNPPKTGKAKFQKIGGIQGPTNNASFYLFYYDDNDWAKATSPQTASYIGGSNSTRNDDFASLLSSYQITKYNNWDDGERDRTTADFYDYMNPDYGFIKDCTNHFEVSPGHTYSWAYDSELDDFVLSESSADTGMLNFEMTNETNSDLPEGHYILVERASHYWDRMPDFIHFDIHEGDEVEKVISNDFLSVSTTANNPDYSESEEVTILDNTFTRFNASHMAVPGENVHFEDIIKIGSFYELAVNGPADISDEYWNDYNYQTEFETVKFAVYGELMEILDDGSTIPLLDDDGNPIVSSVRNLSVNDVSVSTTMSFDFPGTTMAGKDFVIYQHVYPEQVVQYYESLGDVTFESDIMNGIKSTDLFNSKTEYYINNVLAYPGEHYGGLVASNDGNGNRILLTEPISQIHNKTRTASQRGYFPEVSTVEGDSITQTHYSPIQEDGSINIYDEMTYDNLDSFQNYIVRVVVKNAVNDNVIYNNEYTFGGKYGEEYDLAMTVVDIPGVLVSNPYDSRKGSGTVKIEGITIPAELCDSFYITEEILLDGDVVASHTAKVESQTGYIPKISTEAATSSNTGTVDDRGVTKVKTSSSLDLVDHITGTNLPDGWYRVTSTWYEATYNAEEDEWVQGSAAFDKNGNALTKTVITDSFAENAMSPMGYTMVLTDKDVTNLSSKTIVCYETCEFFGDTEPAADSTGGVVMAKETDPGNTEQSLYFITPVKILKTDAYGTPLAGAVLKVSANDTQKTELERWTSTTTAQEVYLDNGTYILTEVTAPKGYALGKEVTFTVENGKVFIDGAEVAEATITYKNHMLTNLPTTGGKGTGLFKIIGLFLIMLSLSGLILKKKKDIAD